MKAHGNAVTQHPADDNYAPVDPAQQPMVCQLPEGSRIKLIGLGGIGCVVLDYLARFLTWHAQPMRLVLVDGDTFEPANAARMQFAALGNKAQVKAAEILGQLGETALTIAAMPVYVDEHNVAEIARENDVLFVAVDNHVTRRLISERVQQLQNVALFSGGNDGVNPPHQRGTYGNVQVHIRRDGQDLTVPVTRYHPEIAQATAGHPGDVSCGELVKSVPQILFTNLAVASCMLNAFLAYSSGRLAYQEAKLDILEARCLPQFPLKEAIPAPGSASPRLQINRPR